MAKPAAVPLNSIDPAILQPIVNKLEAHDEDIESEKGKHMKRCRDIRDRKSGVYDEAQARGIPKKELKSFMKMRGLRKKIDDEKENLEPEQRETVEMISESFGDARDLGMFAWKVGQVAATQGKQSQQASAAAH